VLLVRQIDVVEERTLAREEGAGDLEGLGMPELGLLVLHLGVPGGLLIHLEDEPDLSGVAEVGDAQEAHFGDERLPSELHLVFPLLQEFLHVEGLQLHDGANG